MFLMRKNLEPIIFTALLLLSVLGGVMRFVNLDNKEFWFDESCTSLIVSGHLGNELTEDVVHRVVPMSELTKYRIVGDDSTPSNLIKANLEDEPGHSPLFYFLELWFCQLFGSSTPFVMRMVSAIISVLTLPIIFWLGRETYSSRTLAALTMTFAALSPALIYFAQEARDYSLGLFWMFLSSAFLLYALRTSRKIGWCGYALALVIGFYSWLMMLCVAAGQLLYVFASKTRRATNWWQYLLALGSAGLLFSPWLILLRQKTFTLKQAYNWMEPPVPYNTLMNVWMTIPCKAFALFGSITGNYENLLLAVTILEAVTIVLALRFARGTKYLQLSIILVWFIVFGGQDILLGGARSAPFRYQMMVIGCTIILFPTIVEWFLERKLTILRPIAAVIAIFAIGLETSSSVYLLSQKTWPNKSMSLRYTYPIAQRLTQEKEPVIVCEQRRINLVEMLDLASVLNGDTRLIFLSAKDPQPIPETMSRFYLWNPSPELKKQLSESGYQLIEKIEGIPYLEAAERAESK